MGYTSLRSSSRTSSTSETILRWGFLSNLTISSSSLDWVLVSSSTIRLGAFLLPLLFWYVEPLVRKIWRPATLPLCLCLCCKVSGKSSWFYFFRWKSFGCCLSCLGHFHNVMTLFSWRFPSCFWIKHFLSLKVLRNPSNYLADYIAYDRSLYLNFDSPSKQLVW